MKRTTIVAAGLALLVLGAGAVAAQPSSPADVQHPESPADAPAVDDPVAQNASAENRTDEEVKDENEDAERAGPPVDMPSQVPDHVSEIHALIGQFVEGDLDGSLGDAIRGVLGGQERGAQQDGERSNAGQASPDQPSAGQSNAGQPSAGQASAGQTNASQANQGQASAEQSLGQTN